MQVQGHAPTMASATNTRQTSGGVVPPAALGGGSEVGKLELFMSKNRGGAGGGFGSYDFE